jgi:hypothetical protein
LDRRCRGFGAAAYGDQKRLQPEVAGKVVPMVRGVFEAAGFEVPADFVKAIQSLQSGRFTTALGVARTEFIGKLSGGAARYDVEIVAPR